MNIKPKSVFLHGRTRFLPGTVYAVPDELGYIFRHHRWADITAEAATVRPSAAELGSELPPKKAGAAELQPQDSTASPG